MEPGTTSPSPARPAGRATQSMWQWPMECAQPMGNLSKTHAAPTLSAKLAIDAMEEYASANVQIFYAITIRNV